MPESAPRITLKDIAERAEMSVSGVSLALRGSPRIPKATRDRVQNLAREMGYQRDPLLSALTGYRRGQTRYRAVFAFLVAGPTPEEWKSPARLAMLEGAQTAATELGYELGSYWLDPALPLERHGRILQSRGVAGLLVAPLSNWEDGVGGSNSRTHGFFNSLDVDLDRFSVVALGRSLRAPQLHRVSPNHFGGLTLVLRRLEALGYQRIGLAVKAEWNERIGRHWTAAVHEYNSRRPRKGAVPPLVPESWNEALFHRWLNDERPDVVIGFLDAVRWIESSGRTMPEDVGFVLLEYARLGRATRPVAALEQNLPEVGAAGLTLLHRLHIAGQRGVPAIRQTVLVDAHWQPGDTVRELPLARSV